SASAPKEVCDVLNDDFELFFVIDVVFAFVTEQEAQVTDFNHVEVGLALRVLHRSFEPFEEGQAREVFANIFELERILFSLLSQREIRNEDRLIYECGQREFYCLEVSLFVAEFVSALFKLFDQSIDEGSQLNRWSRKAGSDLHYFLQHLCGQAH